MRAAALGLLTALALALAIPYLLGLFVWKTIAGGGCQLPTQPASALVGGPVRLPVAGKYRISSPFGPRVHPVTGQLRQHNGLDLSLSPHGGPILAMADGTVTASGPAGAAGLRVTLDHGDGLTSKYLHLAGVEVSIGQRVAAGERLGTEGATGRVTGPHLHWEVWVDGVATDPRRWGEANGLVFDGHAPAAAQLPPTAAQQVRTTVAATVPLNPTNAVALPASVGRWGPEQLGNAAEIITAGRQLGLDDWTITVGVMAAMGESSLRNVDFGDRAGPDSRGLFQQRANGAWGTYQDRMTPRIAATNFFRALVQVPHYRLLSPTIAAHKTQRNADPNHYARFWPDAVLVVATLIADPLLMSRLAASGIQADCRMDAPETRELPTGPGRDCPAKSAEAEAGLSPTALRGLRCGSAAFPAITTTYGLGSRNGRSDHPRGLAVDFMIENYRSPAGNALGWQLAEWTRTHADELQVKYIIWDMKYWSASQRDRGWVPYTRYGSNPDDNLAHRNHVHVSYR